MSLKSFNCPNCGGSLDFPDNATQIRCPYCGSLISEDAVPELVSFEKKTPTIGGGTKVFQVLMWCLLLIPGLVLESKKKKAEAHLMALEQKINHDASQIDNYLEQRVVILENLAALINKEMAFEKEALKTISGYKDGISADSLSSAADNIADAESKIKSVFENHPELMSNAAIVKAMRDNDYLQREVTAAREVYNDSINEWNAKIFEWPCYAIVASKKKYTTKIPFTTTREIRSKARSVMF